jgi:hypothetical protein
VRSQRRRERAALPVPAVPDDRVATAGDRGAHLDETRAGCTECGQRDGASPLGATKPVALVCTDAGERGRASDDRLRSSASAIPERSCVRPIAGRVLEFVSPMPVPVPVPGLGDGSIEARVN